jgi:pyruvate dehydrogenase E2 component (dihydrolipoamide acetyltransferase)
VTTVREVRLPALSATMEEATLLAWNVGPGDDVKQGQAIAEVSTDKVDMDLEAPFSGVIQDLLVEPGTAIPLGATIATIITDEDDLLSGLSLGAADSALPRDSQPSRPPITEPGMSGKDLEPGRIVPASPAARRLAREAGVDLARIAPTGTRGQATPSDVAKFTEIPEVIGAQSIEAQPIEAQPIEAQPIEAQSKGALSKGALGSTPEPVGPPRTAEGPEAASVTDRGIGETSPEQDAKRLRSRRATVQVMDRSAAIPQFTLFRTLSLDKAVVRKGGRSWTTELVRAVAGALRNHPELNAWWDGEKKQVVPFDSLRVGLAIDRPGVGLVVASFADPDRGDPADVDHRLRALAERGQNGKLRPDDLAQASITFSNLGGLGIDRFQALLFPPQPAILSAGSIKMRPVATPEGALKASLTCEVGLTVDHRVADGADGARFLETYASLVDAPDPG